MECYTYLRNVQDLLSDGKTPYERRFGQPFKGPIIPFGSLVEYHPIHQFGKKVLPGLFLGYALYAGGIWKGDVLVADLEELETMDASEIYSKRLSAKEVIFPQKGEFIFPIADGRIKPLGGDQDLRTSTLIRHRPIRGESHLDFLGESEGSLPPPHDSFPDAGETTSGPCREASYTAITLNPESSFTRRESFPIPLKYIQAYPCKTKTSQKPREACKSSWNPRGNPKSSTLTIFLEFGKACEDLSWNHCTSTPHRSETNGIAERAVRRKKEGTSAVLLQSVMHEKWWAGWWNAKVF